MAGLNGDSNIMKILFLYIVLAKITAMSDFKNGVTSCVCVKLDGTSVYEQVYTQVSYAKHYPYLEYGDIGLVGFSQPHAIDLDKVEWG